MAKKLHISNDLPSLPQVMLRVVEVIQRDTADFQHLAEIIRQDTAMAARITEVANSSYFGRKERCSSIERALILMGTDTIKTLVLTASIKQFFGGFKNKQAAFQRLFWKRSLVAAHAASITASLTGYATPDEAYLSGLLLNLGQMALLNMHGKDYQKLLADNKTDKSLTHAEEQHLGISNASLAADIIEDWDIEGFMADAVRFSNEEPRHLLDAHHLVKILRFAKIMSDENAASDELYEAGDTLFGINQALCEELRTRITADVCVIADNLGIDISSDSSDATESSQTAHQKLGDRIEEITELVSLSSELHRPQNFEGILKSIERTLYITLGIDRCLLFFFNEDEQCLKNTISSTDQRDNFVLPTLSERSVVSDAFLQRSTTYSLHQTELSVIDKQLIRFCQYNGISCQPLFHQDKAIGVLVVGVDQTMTDKIIEKSSFISALCEQISHAIYKYKDTQNKTPAQLNYERVVKEAIHEAGNPLSIVRNYLEALTAKLGENHDVNEELNLIKDEIDRVGNILLRLREPDAISDHTVEVDTNIELQKIAKIFADSVCLTKNITLELQLDPELPPLAMKVGHLQQIITNLLKNAIEATPEGGQVTLTSEHNVNFSGTYYTAFVVEDNGTGIPDNVMKNLFSPIESTKGGQHAGLGLSIVKKLTDELNGIVQCRSNKRGTQIQLLLPSPAKDKH